MNKIKWCMPYEKYKISCEYGVLGSKWVSGKHQGVDFVGTESKTIKSITDGNVIGINNIHKNYGNHIQIKNTDDSICIYAHLNKLNVKKGDNVICGMALGVEGSTGNSTGSHLHLEIKAAGKTTDPIKYINDRLKEQTMEINDVTTAKTVLKSKIGLSDDTIKFLEMYKYGDELIIKIAKATL